jgi:hypothetical protein
VVVASHHFDEEQDPDKDPHFRIKVKSWIWIRIRIQVMRIRNPGEEKNLKIGLTLRSLKILCIATP